MNNLSKIFLASVSCAMQHTELEDELYTALARYNDMFIKGSAKRLKLVPER